MHKKSYKYCKDGITILWRANKCTHSGVCVPGISSVFHPSISQWIDMSKAETQRLVEQVQKCLGGALSI